MKNGLIVIEGFALIFMCCLSLSVLRAGDKTSPVVAPEPTATVVPTEAPTPTNLPEPTIGPTPTEQALPVHLDECSEDELWYIEHVLQQRYEKVVAITMDYAGDLVTFYVGKRDGEWILISYSFG